MWNINGLFHQNDYYNLIETLKEMVRQLQPNIPSHIFVKNSFLSGRAFYNKLIVYFGIVKTVEHQVVWHTWMTDW